MIASRRRTFGLSISRHNLPDIIYMAGNSMDVGAPNPLKIPQSWQATTSEPFNCDWDRNNWRMGWSQPKKSYCCTLAPRWMMVCGHVWSLGFGLADDPRDSR